MKLIITHTKLDLPEMALNFFTACCTVIHFHVLLHVMLTTKVTHESRSVNIGKFHGETGDNAFHLLQIGEEQDNKKNKNN